MRFENITILKFDWHHVWLVIYDLPWGVVLDAIQMIAVVFSVIYAAKAAAAARDGIYQEIAARNSQDKQQVVARIEDLINRVTIIWGGAKVPESLTPHLAQLDVHTAVAELAINKFGRYDLPNCRALSKAKSTQDICSIAPKAIDELKVALEETISPYIKWAKVFEQRKQPSRVATKINPSFPKKRQ